MTATLGGAADMASSGERWWRWEQGEILSLFEGVGQFIARYGYYSLMGFYFVFLDLSEDRGEIRGYSLDVDSPMSPITLVTHNWVICETRSNGHIPTLKKKENKREPSEDIYKHISHTTKNNQKNIYTSSVK